jgi:hypothetical protein
LVGDVGAVAVAAAGIGFQVLVRLFQTLKIGGVTLVSYQVVPVLGFVGAAEPAGAPEVGTQAVPFQTLNTGGVTVVLYQVVPVCGEDGAAVPAGGELTGTNAVPL